MWMQKAKEKKVGVPYYRSARLRRRRGRGLLARWMGLLQPILRSGLVRLWCRVLGGGRGVDV
jgi:hypothetical protein